MTKTQRSIMVIGLILGIIFYLSQLNKTPNYYKQTTTGLRVKLDSISVKLTADKQLEPNLMSFENFKDSLGYSESRNKHWIASTAGYIGKYQFGTSALLSGGIADTRIEANEFRLGFVRLYQEYKNASGEEKEEIKQQIDEYFPLTTQDSILSNYMENQEQCLINGLNNRGIEVVSLDTLIGDTINDIILTKSGILAAAHLVGFVGVVEFIASDGAIVTTDGNGVPLTRYLENFGGYAIKD